MNTRIETLEEKKLIGQHLTMSMTNNKTYQLWSSFMPRRREIKNNINTELIAMQLFGPSFDFQNFDINVEFEKWAAVEVKDFNTVPESMDTFTIKGGLYAVFIHKGPAHEGEKTFRYIFETWIPNSDYVIDHRPHFEILGEKYKHNDPNSEEEVWIPIKFKH